MKSATICGSSLVDLAAAAATDVMLSLMESLENVEPQTKLDISFLPFGATSDNLMQIQNDR